MNVRLVIDQRGRRKVFQLKPPTAVVGRSHGNTVRIPSAEVSRRHCRLLMQDGLVTIEDLESVNGTFLNGKRIKQAEVVRPGDRLEVGPVKFVIEYELTPQALEKLRRRDDPVDLLEALADGEEMAGDEVPYLEPVELEPLDFDPVDVLPQDIVDVEPAKPAKKGKPTKPSRPAAEEALPIKGDFDFEATPWQLPDGGDLRDLLAQMEDGEDEPPTKHHNPRKR